MAIGSLGTIAKIPELKRRVIFTLLMLLVYRVGVHVPTPGINTAILKDFFERYAQTLFGVVDMFTGGAMENFSVFSLGIMPYISASIILQLLTMVIPHLERLSKEGEAGRKKITQYHPVRDRRAVVDSGHGYKYRFGPDREHGLPAQVCVRGSVNDHAYCRHSVHHVAGGANNGAGHWKRDITDHICRYRGEDALCDREHDSAGKDR